MADSSAIEWTDATWNPVTGCTKVSPGCDHCYAETFAERWRGTPGHHFEQGFDLRLWPDRLTIPLTWHKPRRIFVNSMSDLFHNAVPDEFIAAVFAVMALTPRHTYQVLTKRPGRMASLLREPFRYQVHKAAREFYGGPMFWPPGWPLANVWLGVSAETQKWANVRVPALLRTPAAVRFISAEPLLGPIDLTRSTRITAAPDRHAPLSAGVDWVIAGGESGHGARPMHPTWVRSLRDQCQHAGTAFFFKQWGGWLPLNDQDDPPPPRRRTAITPAGRAAEWQDPTAQRMARVGKKAAGRLLDGRTWDQFPHPATPLPAPPPPPAPPMSWPAPTGPDCPLCGTPAVRWQGFDPDRPGDAWACEAGHEFVLDPQGFVSVPGAS